MGKALLVIDMPESCLDCPLLTGSDECIVQGEDENFMADSLDALKSRCPLRNMPEKKSYQEIDSPYRRAATMGYNHAIRKILKESEE